MARRRLVVYPVAPIHVEVVGDLVNSDGILFDLAVGIGRLRQRAHIHNFRVALVEFHRLL